MNRKTKNIAMAVLAGAGSIWATNAAQAALVISTSGPTSVSTQDGTFDRYVFNITGLTGGDAVAGPQNQDAEVLLFEGTWNATSASSKILNPGVDATSGTGNWTTYINAAAAAANLNKTSSDPSGNFSSFVNLPNLFSSQSHTGSAGASATTSSSTVNTIHGTATSFTGHWFISSPGTTAGPGGGIEPGSNGGKLATIFVTTGASGSFSGDYGTYASGTQPLSFTFGPAVATNKIVSLTAAPGGAVYGTKLGPITVVGSNGSYQPAFQHSINAATDTVEVNGFNPGATDPEIYALKFSGSPNIANLITDINGNNTNIHAQVPSSAIASLFPGYQIELDATGGLSADQLLAFDFSQAPAADLNGATVTDLAAVPEPASAACILVGSVGMLLGRRRRKA